MVPGPSICAPEGNRYIFPPPVVYVVVVRANDVPVCSLPTVGVTCSASVRDLQTIASIQAASIRSVCVCYDVRRFIAASEARQQQQSGDAYVRAHSHMCVCALNWPARRRYDDDV